MTLQEKLHAVETAIRKALSRLRRPTEGCKICQPDIVSFSKRYPSSYGRILKVDEYFIDYETHVEHNFVYHVFTYNDNKIRVLKLKGFSVIGHEILLSDVLEWLNAINELNTSVILRKEVFEFQRIEKENKLFIVGWDLSKSRLADQSEELINFLYNLL